METNPDKVWKYRIGIGLRIRKRGEEWVGAIHYPTPSTHQFGGGNDFDADDESFTCWCPNSMRGHHGERGVHANTLPELRTKLDKLASEIGLNIQLPPLEKIVASMTS